MLVAMAEDIRVVLIKLADRLHNMRTLDALSEDKRQRIAQETLDVYSPLAHRLGIWELKWQLDDLAFRHLNETRYREISRMLAARRSQREAYVAEVAERLRIELADNRLSADVNGRPKGIYSIHNKMEKYAADGKELSDIYDLYALRVIVSEIPECYSALGVTHRMWSPIPGQFDDYIATPKKNMYQALHTTVLMRRRPSAGSADQDPRDAPGGRVWRCRPLAVQGTARLTRRERLLRRADDRATPTAGVAARDAGHRRVPGAGAGRPVP